MINFLKAWINEKKIKIGDQFISNTEAVNPFDSLIYTVVDIKSGWVKLSFGDSYFCYRTTKISNLKWDFIKIN